MVIDGNSILHRAFHGVRPLSTRDGTPTNAIYGFLNILLKLLDEERPEALCVTFDRKAPTFRHLLYPEYKATRKGMPEDLVIQMPLLKEILRAMNIPIYELDGWEADDLLGTISVRDAAAGWDTVVVTGDRDALQLINEHTTVKLVTTRMGQTTTQDMTPKAFRKAYGFEPIHMVDLKALMGDASDHIPGVKGIGEKTAMELIQAYDSITNLYAHMPDLYTAPDTPVRPHVIQKLADGKAQAELSYDLAFIHCDAPLFFSPEDARRGKIDRDALYTVFAKLEFSKLMERFGLTTEERQEDCYDIPSREVVTERNRMEVLLSLWRTQHPVSFLALPNLDGVCTVWEKDNTRKVALFFPDRLDCYPDFLQGFFSSDIPKATHGVKHLAGELLNEQLSTGGFHFDTELAAYLLAPADGSYALDKLSLSYFHAPIPPAEIYQESDAFRSLLALEPVAATPEASCVEPVEVLVRHTALVNDLYHKLSERLAELDLERVLYEIELPLCPVLADMERAGVLVDQKSLRAYGVLLDEQLQKSETAICELAGKSFQINSTKQLGKVLFEDLKLPPVKKTKTGYSTSAETLEKLRGQHPIIDAILEYRQYAKLKSTYVDGLKKAIAPDGRIHTSFQNTATSTGRLSSTEPNLQNIPVRTELGAKLRSMFVAAPGHMLVDADYSQIELRILAHISGDKAMQAAFLRGEDIHTATAAQVFDVPVGAVTHEMRRRAKAVNFGIVYGISPASLGQDIGVTTSEAKEYMERYFNTFPGVRAYMKEVVEQARKDGFVCTPMGRRRWLPELKFSNWNVRAFGERAALNTPIQGAAADIIKLAMIRVWHAIQEAGLQARLILQVHDELIVECPASEAETVQALLCHEMERVADYAVPLKATAGIGKNWGEAKG